MSSTSNAGAAGDLLLHPLSLLSLAGLLLNDHVFKAAAVGTAFDVVTGKVSDFCGVCFLPLLLVSGLELAQALFKRYRGPDVRVAVVAAVSVAVFFALMKTLPFFGDVYAQALGALQWPFYAAVAVVKGDVVPAVRAVRHVVDASDVVAVPCAFVVVVLQRKRVVRISSKPAAAP